MEKKKYDDHFVPAGGRLLQQSVLKHIRRKGDGVLEGAAIGYDAAIFQNGNNCIVQTTGVQPTGRVPEAYPLTAGELAWITADNQLATCGAVPVSMQVLLVAGTGCEEEIIRREMQKLAKTASEKACPITGGNTVYFGDAEDCLVQLVVTGEPDRELSLGRRKPAAGDRVFFLGETGMLGADLLVKAGRERLLRRFSESYLRTMEAAPEDFSVRAAACAALKAGAVFLHDVSNCGVHAALYQLSEAAGCGIRVRHEGLTIRQSVIELCEELSVNPYQLLGTGGLLAVVPQEKAEQFEKEMAEHFGKEMTEHFEKEMTARVRDAGELTKEKARVVYAEHFPMERYLNLPEEDALEQGLRLLRK